MRVIRRAHPEDDRIDRIVKNTHARFIIQHSLEDFATLPKLPQYLQ